MLLKEGERSTWTDVWVSGLVALVLVGLALWMANNNDYMTYRDYPVTFIDRSAPTSCHKGSCRANHTGLFKLEDGTFFERPIGVYMYTQMHLGEKFNLNLRPMDIKQTPANNVKWFFMPIIVYCIATFFAAIALIFAGTWIHQRIQEK